MNLAEEMGKRLKSRRAYMGLRQVELAKKVGSTQRMISHYEKGKGFIPIKLLITIAETLKVQVDYFFPKSMSNCKSQK